MDIWSAISHLYAERFDVLDAYMNGKQSAWERGDIDDIELYAAFCLRNVARIDLVEPARKWTQIYSKSYAANHVLANLLVNVGWQARGIETSDVTVQRRFEEMQKHFNEAAEHVESALSLATSPVLTLRLWLQISTAGEYPLNDEGRLQHFESLLPKSVILCSNKMWQLAPKWGGDEKLLDDFFLMARSYDFTQEQRLFLESSYLEEKAGIVRCQGDFGSALELLEKSIAVLPTAYNLSEQGEVHQLRNEHPAAARSFERASVLTPSYDNYYSLGRALDKIGHKPEAVAAFEKALSLGHGDAALHLAEHATAEPPSPAVKAKCEAWLKVGAAQYSSWAMSKTADFYHLGSAGYSKNTDLCSKAWHLASDWGSGNSSFNLAISYWNGKNGLPKDYTKALNYAQAAVDVNYESAYAILGRMYYLGHGTPVNYDAAFPYLEAGAENNDARAMNALIQSLWFGQGTKADHPLAKQWLEVLKKLDVEEYEDARSNVLGIVGRIRGFFAT